MYSTVSQEDLQVHNYGVNVLSNCIINANRAVHNFFCKGGQPGGKLSNILRDCCVSGSVGLHAEGADVGMLKGGADTVQDHRKQSCIWTGKCIEARSADLSARSAEKFFHLHYSVVWIGSRTTFVLCTHCYLVDYHSQM